MTDTQKIDWFKTEIAPVLVNYEFQYRFHEEGDFGSLTQIIFNSPKNGGGIDFWGLGWLAIEFYDYEKDGQLLNVLFEPHQKEEKEKAFDKLLELLEIKH